MAINLGIAIGSWFRVEGRLAQKASALGGALIGTESPHR
jgi:hypothetical protein